MIPTTGPMMNKNGRSPSFSVFLDANVIRGMDTTDIILTLASQRVFAVHWSEYVIEESIRNRPPGLPLDKALARARQMNVAFPEAMVEGYQHLTQWMPADRKDQPVMAAAVHCEATALVTENVKDFWPGADPSSKLLCLRTSDLLRTALEAFPGRTVEALQRRVGALHHRPYTFPQYLDRIVGHQELAEFVRALNAKVEPSMRGTDPRLQRSVTRLTPTAKALAGFGSMEQALRHERLRVRRYPRAREWGRRPGGIER